MTPEQLDKLHISQDWFIPMLATFERFDISTPERQAGFIGQCQHESGNFKRVRENLNYSAKALRAVFGRHRITDEECEKYGRTDDHPADKEMIANTIYGGEWGAKNLGNTEPGDGWQYSGRGVIQLTGRANYQRLSDAVGVDFVSHPYLLEKPEHAIISAGWFWDSKNLNRYADDQDWLTLTKRINGGTIGLEDRVAHIEHALAVLRDN